MNNTGYFESLVNMTLEKQSTAQGLLNAATSDHSECDAIRFAVRHLRSTIDRTAKRCAKERANWHDDTEADDHAEHHAPAIEQYPREIRDLAARMLVHFYLDEFVLEDGHQAKKDK